MFSNFVFFLMLGLLKNKNKGPGSIQHRGGKCIHIHLGGHTKPSSGQKLVFYDGCGESRLEFKIASDNKLMHVNHNMCVKPVQDTDGSQVGNILLCSTDHLNCRVKNLPTYQHTYNYLPTYHPSYLLIPIYLPTYLPTYTYLPTPTYLRTYLYLPNINNVLHLIFKIGVYDNCDPSDTWSWTPKGSLKYKNKWCIKPASGYSNPGNSVNLLLDSTCDQSQNFFKFVASKYLFVFYENL